MTNHSPQAKKPINDWLYDQTKGIVQSGPFKGMLLPVEESWGDGNLSCKLLGCYEQELHDDIEREIARLSLLPEPQIIDIGCAEGYYAVGMARRLPKASVYAVDISKTALTVTEWAAGLNGAKVTTNARPIGDIVLAPDLVIVDCEGAEVNYLGLDKWPSLAHATIIVECHGFEGNPITQTLEARFAGTHGIKNIIEGGRDPNQFVMLRGMHSLDRWLAVSEGRPCMMDWLVMRPFQFKVPQ